MMRDKAYSSQDRHLQKHLAEINRKGSIYNRRNCLPLSYLCATPISSEALKQYLDRLTQDQLQQVADFIAFLEFRDRHHRRLTLNPSQLAALDLAIANNIKVPLPHLPVEFS